MYAIGASQHILTGLCVKTRETTAPHTQISQSLDWQDNKKVMVPYLGNCKQNSHLEEENHIFFVIFTKNRTRLTFVVFSYFGAKICIFQRSVTHFRNSWQVWLIWRRRLAMYPLEKISGLNGIWTRSQTILGTSWEI